MILASLSTFFLSQPPGSRPLPFHRLLCSSFLTGKPKELECQHPTASEISRSRARHDLRASVSLSGSWAHRYLLCKAVVEANERTCIKVQTQSYNVSAPSWCAPSRLPRPVWVSSSFSLHPFQMRTATGGVHAAGGSKSGRGRGRVGIPLTLVQLRHLPGS